MSRKIGTLEHVCGPGGPGEQRSDGFPVGVCVCVCVCVCVHEAADVPHGLVPVRNAVCVCMCVCVCLCSGLGAPDPPPPHNNQLVRVFGVEKNQRITCPSHHPSLTLTPLHAHTQYVSAHTPTHALLYNKMCATTSIHPRAHTHIHTHTHIHAHIHIGQAFSAERGK
jgi:hypothetical protein